MKLEGNNFYKGGTSTCNCYVEWQGKKTYVQNEVTLSEDYYLVVDKGLSVETDEKIWGSNYGAFKFQRQ